MYVQRCDDTASLQTTKDDERITPLGCFLRRYDIDEYPQLFNILKGDMSVVGPRPHPVRMLIAGIPYSQIVPNHDLRHSARPGLTGLAQINGCAGPLVNANQALLRHKFDLLYLNTMGFFSDLGIVAKTFRRHVSALGPSDRVCGQTTGTSLEPRLAITIARASSRVGQETAQRLSGEREPLVLRIGVHGRRRSKPCGK